MNRPIITRFGKQRSFPRSGNLPWVKADRPIITGRCDNEYPAYALYSAIFCVPGPLISHELSISPAIQGFLLSSFFWTYCLMQIPGGMLADRFLPRSVIAGATIGWGAFAALAAAFTGRIAMLLTRVSLGLLEAAGLADRWREGGVSRRCPQMDQRHGVNRAFNHPSGMQSPISWPDPCRAFNLG
jgi:hypothetical protein